MARLRPLVFVPLRLGLLSALIRGRELNRYTWAITFKFNVHSVFIRNTFSVTQSLVPPHLPPHAFRKMLRSGPCTRVLADVF